MYVLQKMIMYYKHKCDTLDWNEKCSEVVRLSSSSSGSNHSRNVIIIVIRGNVCCRLIIWVVAWLSLARSTCGSTWKTIYFLQLHRVLQQPVVQLQWMTLSSLSGAGFWSVITGSKMSSSRFQPQLFIRVIWQKLLHEKTVFESNRTTGCALGLRLWCS